MLEICSILMRKHSGFIEHPTTNRLFEDKRLPYRFNDLEQSKKKKKTKGASKITFNLWDFNGRALQSASQAKEGGSATLQRRVR